MQGLFRFYLSFKYLSNKTIPNCNNFSLIFYNSSLQKQVTNYPKVLLHIPLFLHQYSHCKSVLSQNQTIHHTLTNRIFVCIDNKSHILDPQVAFLKCNSLQHNQIHPFLFSYKHITIPPQT